MTENQFDQVWDMSVITTKEKARSRAAELAEKDGRKEISAIDSFEAIKEYVPGFQISQNSKNEPGWWNKNVTGFIGITAFLTLVFGILGLLPSFQGNASAAGFLEVAKIFAGALVGGAAGAAASRK